MNVFNFIMGEAHLTVKAAEDEAEGLAKQLIHGFVDKSPHPSGANNPSRISPYSKGEYVNNWQVGGSLNNYYTEATVASKEGKIKQLTSQLDGWFKKNDRVFLFINSPYAAKVEYYGWNDGAQAYYPVLNTMRELGLKG